MRNMCLAASLAVLSGLIAGCATDGQTIADDVAGAFGAPVNRPALDRYVQESQAQNAWMQAQTASAEADTALTQQQSQLRALVEARRKWLAQTWVDMGCSDEDAVARASAWSPSLSDEAVVRQLREEGSKSAIPAIKNATASFNYGLADQLMLAFVIVQAEEKRAAELSDTIPDIPAIPESYAGAHGQPSCAVAHRCSSTSASSEPPNQ